MQHWQSRAGEENSRFYVRWKTIWDDDFPHACKSFVKSIKKPIQNHLRKALQKGSSTFVAASFANFISKLIENYCKQWKEQPSEYTLDEFFSSFKKICATPVMEEFGFYEGSYYPSWVTDVLFEMLYSTLDKFNASRQPYSLLQLSQDCLKENDALDKLRTVFQDVSDGKLRDGLLKRTEWFKT